MFASSKSVLDKLIRIFGNKSRCLSKTTNATNRHSITSTLDRVRNIQTQAPGIALGHMKLLKLQNDHSYPSSLDSNNQFQLAPASLGSAVSAEQSREFAAVFPDIVRELTESGKHADAPEASKWIAELLQYNVPIGKGNRGLATVLAYKALESPEKLTPENIRLANIMGWCVEMFNSLGVVLDDFLDGGETRGGALCWYLRPGVGVSVIKDIFLIQTAMFSTLKIHFRGKSYYTSVLETFHEMLLKAAIGQHLDCAAAQGDRPDLNKFTMERYNVIAKYKLSYYTFQMPISLALLLTGIEDPETHRQAKAVLIEAGKFYQVQNDFLDVFGDPSATGKNANDIEKGKCTWLAVVALQRASPEQRKLMEQCYGSDKPGDVETIKALYEDLGLPHVYGVYVESTYSSIRTQIQQLTRGLPHHMFFMFLDKIFGKEA